MLKISITRALSELKVLQKRFEKEVRNLSVISIRHGQILMDNSSIRPEDFREAAKSQLQRIEDLQKRIFEIKTKIQQSNAITVVKIGSREMTVLEALVKKSVLENQKDLLAKLKSSLVTSNHLHEKAISTNEARVSKQLEDATKNTSVKLDPEIEKEIKKSVESLYPIEVIDPCKISDKIKELEEEIEDFENNVDFALSESNALTQIEVGD
jgi:tetrahydromethanopterin S-methyltransferase subunit G